MEQESKGLARVREIHQDRSRRAKELKAEGRKVIGYTCTYVPVEILTALDIFPYRIFGDMREPITEADRVLPVSFCPLMRSCLDLVCKGKYDFLDGVVAVHCCDAQEKTAHAWKSTVRYPFFPYIDMPGTTHGWGLETFKETLNDFKKACESLAGRELSPERLRQSIKIYNEQRALVRELYELRKSEPPLISGTETLQVMMALGSIPVDEGNELLKGVINQVKERKGSQKEGERILLWGATIDSLSLTEVIEGYDANLVMDDICPGSRSHFADVKVTEDPIDGLAYRYLVEVKCPRTFNEAVVAETRKDHWADLDARFGYLGSHIKEWKVDGVILLLVRYCDPFAFEVPEFKDYLDSIGVANIYLEHDYSEGALAALRTRVQAFIEMLTMPGQQ